MPIDFNKVYFTQISRHNGTIHGEFSIPAFPKIYRLGDLQMFGACTVIVSSIETYGCNAVFTSCCNTEQGVVTRSSCNMSKAGNKLVMEVENGFFYFYHDIVDNEDVSRSLASYKIRIISNL